MSKIHVTVPVLHKSYPAWDFPTAFSWTRANDGA